MEFTESVLDSIQVKLSLKDSDDVDMMHVEEGEVVDEKNTEKMGDGNLNEVNTELCKENRQPAWNMNKNKKRKKKKTSKKKEGASGSCGLGINRFVRDVCKRLRERKTYLVYTAVGVLGIPALSDLVKEVDAIQACGGQKTTNGDRLRKGGGILWNIMKVRDPNAFKEIMKRGKEFEKQFKQPIIGQRPLQSNTGSHDVISEIKITGEEHEEATAEVKRKSVHDRIRVPVSYDDLIVEELPKEQHG